MAIIEPTKEEMTPSPALEVCRAMDEYEKVREECLALTEKLTAYANAKLEKYRTENQDTGTILEPKLIDFYHKIEHALEHADYLLIEASEQALEYGQIKEEFETKNDHEVEEANYPELVNISTQVSINTKAALLELKKAENILKEIDDFLTKGTSSTMIGNLSSLVSSAMSFFSMSPTNNSQQTINASNENSCKSNR